MIPEVHSNCEATTIKVIGHALLKVVAMVKLWHPSQRYFQDASIATAVCDDTRGRNKGKRGRGEIQDENRQLTGSRVISPLLCCHLLAIQAFARPQLRYPSRRRGPYDHQPVMLCVGEGEKETDLQAYQSCEAIPLLRGCFCSSR